MLLYAYDSSAGRFHEVARGLVGRLGRARQGAISVQVLQEFYVNAVAKIAVRLTPEQARAPGGVEPLGEALTLASDALAASAISEDNGISFWDAMIVRSASELGCPRALDAGSQRRTGDRRRPHRQPVRRPLTDEQRHAVARPGELAEPSSNARAPVCAERGPARCDPQRGPRPVRCEPLRSLPELGGPLAWPDVEGAVSVLTFADAFTGAAALGPPGARQGGAGARLASSGDRTCAAGRHPRPPTPASAARRGRRRR